MKPILRERRVAAFLTTLVLASVVPSAVVLAQAAPAPPETGSARAPEADAWALLSHAQARSQVGRCDEAIELYTRALSAAPTLVRARRGRAICYASTEQRAAAVADYREVVRLWPGDAQAWGSLGWSLLLLERFDEAQAATRNAVELDPLSHAWATNLGHSFLLQGDEDRARHFYRLALEALADEAQFNEGPLADFELLLKKGWATDRVARARDWMRAEFPGYRKHREALAAIRHAEALARKDDREATLRATLAALEAAEGAFGAEHLRVAVVRNALGASYMGLARYAEALPQYQRALAIREKLHGLEHARVAASLNNLATLYQAMDRHADALPLFQRSVAILDKAIGAEHPDLATPLDNLAGSFSALGRYAEALPLQQRSLAIRERALGPEHLDVAASLNELAALYDLMERHAEAVELHQRSLAIRERLRGSEHVDVATGLDSLAWSYRATGEYARALPLFERSLAIREKALGADDATVVTSLNNIAGVYRDMSQYAQALPPYQRALAIREKTLGPEHPAVGQSLEDLAWIYASMAQYAEAFSLMRRALAITEKARGPEHPDVAVCFNNLGLLHKDLGQYTQALPLLQRALAISERSLGPDSLAVATRLNNLGLLYQAMGQYAQALADFQRALAISEKALGPDAPLLALRLNNLAGIYQSIGQYAQALPLARRALAIREKSLGTEHAHVANSLTTLAGLYRDLNQYARALPLYQRALAIDQKVYGAEHPKVAADLGNLGSIYRWMGQYDQALPLYQRALAISEKTLGPEHPSIGTRLNNLAALYRSMGQTEQALPLYQRAVEIGEKTLGANHPAMASRLKNLAMLYRSTGRRTEALALAYRALQIASRGDLPDELWRVEDFLRSTYGARTSQRELAIYWGKRAVGTIQAMRASLASIDPELQQSFLEDKRNAYVRLADLLIAAGRLAEGQEVLAMLKQEELFDFQRRAADTDPRKLVPTYTGAEVGWQQRFGEISGQLGQLGRELEELRRQAKTGLSDAEQARRAQIEADLKVAQQAFAAYLTRMEQDVARITQADRERSRAIDERRLGRVSELQGTLSKLGHGAVALHYLVTDDRVRIIVTLPTTQVGREALIQSAQLNRMIQEFRGALQDPRQDPRPVAQRLYTVLIAPVAQDLAQFNAQTLMLSLDDRLRYIPFAALYDGQQYLIERYQMALLTEASRDKLRERPEAQWRLAGLGLTQGVQVAGGALREAQSFSALPEVRRELEAIVKSGAKGVLPGEVQFDAQFTAATLQRVLDAGYPVLHLASHFQFRPGSDEASYLVLGNGQSLSLAELKGERFNFQNIDLLTLSACETAVGGGKDANGQEIEGFGALAQIKGARGVLASLWKVADTSTATLMVRYYSSREQEHLTKAEALQRAQLALLRGTQTATEATAERGATRTPAAALTAAAPAFATDPKVPFAHPFYWAPFILMGNWL